jgi:uncharacterized membrane protein
VEFDSRDVALSAVFAALYVVVNVVQMATVGNPTVYGPVQLRVADCLIVLAAVLGWPVIGGVTLGCFLTNAFYFIGTIDVALGPVANLFAATVVFLLRRRHIIACVAGALPIGLIVGSYLWLFFPPPDAFGFLPAWLGMIASITLSSLVVVTVLGYVLLTAISQPMIIEPLKSRGLKRVT